MIPVNILIVVDFPAPFGPRYPTSSPGRMSKEMSLTAGTTVCCRVSSVRRPAKRPWN